MQGGFIAEINQGSGGRGERGDGRGRALDPRGSTCCTLNPAALVTVSVRLVPPVRLGTT